eukprot:259910-Pyramimonas_sp.AAC.1
MPAAMPGVSGSARSAGSARRPAFGSARDSAMPADQRAHVCRDRREHPASSAGCKRQLLLRPLATMVAKPDCRRGGTTAWFVKLTAALASA